MEIITKSGDAIIYDDNDHELISKYRWHTKRVAKKRYAAGRLIPGRKDAQIVQMHRLIMGVLKNRRITVDHINGNGLDNRRENLRLCSIHQNSHNAVRITSHGFVGISYQKAHNKWRASICYKGKRIYLGEYDQPEEAAAVYDSHARKYYGPMAKVNFPRKVTELQREASRANGSKGGRPRKNYNPQSLPANPHHFGAEKVGGEVDVALGDLGGGVASKGLDGGC